MDFVDLIIIVWIEKTAGLLNSFLVPVNIAICNFFKKIYRISVVQAIYISLFMGVTKNCRDPAPNLY